MKIAVIITRFLPNNIGGLEIAAENIVLHLANKGHEVHLITTLDSNQEKNSKMNNIYIHRIRTIEIPLFRNTVFALRSLFLVKELKFDIIHAQTCSFHNAGFVAYVIKKILHIPYVVWADGPDVYLSKGLERLINFNCIIKNANATIVLTDRMKLFLQKDIDTPLFVLPNGIDLSKYGFTYKRNIRDDLNIPLDEKIIVFVGRLDPIKGLNYLIDAFNIMSNNHHRVSLLLIGKGSEYSKLSKLVKKYNLDSKVHFIGEVNNNEIPYYLSACDIFVLPSLSEGFGIVVLEAMASGLPIVASNVGGLPDIIQDTVNGFLVEPKNSGEIAKKILFLLNNSNECIKIGMHNKEYIKNYNWINIVDKLESIYLEVLNKRVL